MAKRKTKIEQSEEATPPERVHKAGGQAELVSDEHWRITYNPQWHTELDLGVVEGDIKRVIQVATEAISGYIHDHFKSHDGSPIPEPRLNWQQNADNYWTANGSDGIQETTLALVRITKVVGE